MLIYNTTFHIEESATSLFLIWMDQEYIPQIKKSNLLFNPRLCKVLSHQEADSNTYTMQWEVENSAQLHQWHLTQGSALNEELKKIFKEQVVGFPTLMEVYPLTH